MSDQSKHVVIAVTDKPTRHVRWNERPGNADHSWSLGAFSWHEAQAAFEALDAEPKPEGIRWYAVRSTSDPQWADLPEPSYYKGKTDERHALLFPLARKAKDAARKHRSKEISTSIQWAIREKGQSTLAGLEKVVQADLHVRGIELKGWELHDAVKARVLVGRCKAGCDRAFWMPKKEGPLHKRRCHVCNGSLYQTTTTLRKAFHRLQPEEVAA